MKWPSMTSLKTSILRTCKAVEMLSLVYFECIPRTLTRSRPVQFVWNFSSALKENRTVQFQVDFFRGNLNGKKLLRKRETLMQEINADSWRLVKVLEVNVRLLPGYRKLR